MRKLDPEIRRICRNLDLEKMVKLNQKTFAGDQLPVTKENMEITMHKIRANSNEFSEIEQRLSIKWLESRGYGRTLK